MVQVAGERDATDLAARQSAARFNDARRKLHKVLDTFEDFYAGHWAIRWKEQDQLRERIWVADNGKVGGSVVIPPAESGAADSRWRRDQSFVLVLNVKVMDCP